MDITFSRYLDYERILVQTVRQRNYTGGTSVAVQTLEIPL